MRNCCKRFQLTEKIKTVGKSEPFLTVSSSRSLTNRYFFLSAILNFRYFHDLSFQFLNGLLFYFIFYLPFVNFRYFHELSFQFLNGLLFCFLSAIWQFSLFLNFYGLFLSNFQMVFNFSFQIGFSFYIWRYVHFVIGLL